MSYSNRFDLSFVLCCFVALIVHASSVLRCAVCLVAPSSSYILVVNYSSSVVAINISFTLQVTEGGEEHQHSVARST